MNRSHFLVIKRPVQRLLRHVKYTYSMLYCQDLFIVLHSELAYITGICFILFSRMYGGTLPWTVRRIRWQKTNPDLNQMNMNGQSVCTSEGISTEKTTNLKLRSVQWRYPVIKRKLTIILPRTSQSVHYGNPQFSRCFQSYTASIRTKNGGEKRTHSRLLRKCGRNNQQMPFDMPHQSQLGLQMEGSSAKWTTSWEISRQMLQQKCLDRLVVDEL